MPRKIPVTSANCGQFEFIAGKNNDHATYDMNDEDYTDQSNHDSVFAFMSTSTVRRDTQNDSQSPTTDGAATTSHAPVGASLENLSLSIDGSSVAGKRVSWSYSEGSTYISEGTGNQGASAIYSTPSNQSPKRDLLTIEVPVPVPVPAPVTDTTGTCIQLPAKTKVVEHKCITKGTGNKCPLNATTTPTTEANCNTGTSDAVSAQRIKKEPCLKLDHVDYYSGVDVASTNDGISLVGFISKEDTSQIFCRRLIPLEIPVYKRSAAAAAGSQQDDISAFSSVEPLSVMPTGDSLSIHAVHTRRGTVAQTTGTEGEKSLPIHILKLKDVDYLSVVDVASHNHDISTVAYRVSHKVAAAAFERNQATSQLPGDEHDVLVSWMEKHKKVSCHNRLDSISTLGSTSVTSKTSESISSSYDVEEKEETLQSGQSNTTRRPAHDEGYANNSGSRISRKDRTITDSNPNHAHLLAEQPESTHHRIMNLKNKIKQMQVASTMESLPETRFQKTSDSTFIQESTDYVSLGTPMSRVPRKNQDIEPTTRQNMYFSDDSRRGNGMLVTCPKTPESRSRQQVKQVTNQGSQVKIESIAPSTIALSEMRGEVPSVVTPVIRDSDDVSTIDCDLGHQGNPFNRDVELAGAKRIEFTPDVQHSKRGIISYWRAGSHRVSLFLRQTHTSLEHNAKCRCMEVFSEKFLHGRSRTEKAIVGVIVLSFTILFILIISIVSG